MYDVHPLASEAKSPNCNPDDNRRLPSNFSPSIWGDYFLSYASMEAPDSEGNKQHAQDLKEEVKRMMLAPEEMPSQKLQFIDDIQRLGLSYHFENEIGQILQQIHHKFSHEEEDDDLRTTALRFRLLRQQGYTVSCNIFNKFKNDDGNFNESLKHDVLCLLSLYEASHIQMSGEDILNEALIFATLHLKSAALRLSSSSPLRKHITHALYQPLWKGVPRVEARRHLSIYQEDETLLKLAKLDFNIVQKFHQKELSEMTRWWKDLDIVNKLPFARNRAVESYFWAWEVYFQPEYNFARMVLGKVVALLTIVDDIYDVHGTFEELECFTEAIERWDISASDRLPDYMKVCYEALLNFFAELEASLANKGISYRAHYAREAFKCQVRAYSQETKWLKLKYTPTMEEYMSVERFTSFFALATTSFVGILGAIVTQDSMDWVFSEPKILKATSIIGRLMNDIVGHKFEQNREHIPSAVECYMKHHGATEEEATDELTKQVNDAWKDINEEWLHNSSSIPRPLLLLILNLARSCELLYKGQDVFTHPEHVLKDYIASLFIEPVPI